MIETATWEFYYTPPVRDIPPLQRHSLLLRLPHSSLPLSRETLVGPFHCGLACVNGVLVVLSYFQIPIAIPIIVTDTRKYMASLQILKSCLSTFSVSHSNPRPKSFCFCSESNSQRHSRIALNFRSHRSSKLFIYRSFRVYSKLQEKDNQSNGEEPPESLFTKELKRRGMNPTSLLDESKRSNYGDEEMKFKEEDGGYSKRNAVSTEYEKSLSNQRERSMALNSEGLEGLIPRAKLLLSIGATFFLAFWPLILITVAFTSALYLYFGSTFIHDGSTTPITLPQYVDPYALLEDERISQRVPRVN